MFIYIVEPSLTDDLRILVRSSLDLGSLRPIDAHLGLWLGWRPLDGACILYEADPFCKET